MSAVAGDQYVAVVVVDGGNKYRPVLLWQIHRIRQQRIVGTHAADFDPASHRIQRKLKGPASHYFLLSLLRIKHRISVPESNYFPEAKGAVIAEGRP